LAANRNTITEKIMEQLISFLELGRASFDQALAEANFETRFGRFDKSDVILNPGTNASLQVSYAGTAHDPVATGARDDTYNFNVDIMVVSKKPEIDDALLEVASSSVINYLLNDLASLQQTIAGYDWKWYHSWAGQKQFGYRRDKAIRTARIPWFCKVYNFYY